MVAFLIIYGTGEGQTAKVATCIGDVLAERGHNVTTVGSADTMPSHVGDEFDAVLIGTSIHGGRHQTEIVEFVQAHLDALAVKPTAFFQVSLSSATEDGRAQAAGYVEEFIETTGWNPDRIGLFGGALRYSKYGFLKRLMMKQIAKRTITDMPEADMTGDIEFTDWHEVESFAADVATFVEGRLGTSSSPANDSATDDP